MPKFTVITATWNRSRHIVPTIRSVLAQRFTDFEYLIIGDCCTDDTEEIVKPFLSDRVRWLSTSQRWMGQSGPNNVGIENARGKYIAYIGHDDIWGPEHLRRHFDVLSRADQPDFSVAACMNYGSPGADMNHVTALDPQAGLDENFFFVPTAIAHRRAVTDRIGPWKHANDSDRFVDVEFEARAQQAGMKFVRNGALTAFKFTAGSRYLSYLDPDSHEQVAFLDRMQAPGSPATLAAEIAFCAQNGRSYPSQPIFGDGWEKGESARRARAMKGMLGSECVLLKRACKLEHHKGWRAQDWHGTGPDDQGYLWTGPNPAPRMLIPFVSQGRVDLKFRLLHPHPAVFEAVKLTLNGTAILPRFTVSKANSGLFAASVELTGDLRSGRASVLRFHQPDWAMLDGGDRGKRGLAVGIVEIRPLPPTAIGRLALKFRQAAAEIAGDLKTVLPVAARRNNP